MCIHCNYCPIIITYIMQMYYFKACPSSQMPSLMVRALWHMGVSPRPLSLFKVEYHANENPLKSPEKIAYVGQRLMYPIIKIITLPS